MMCSVLRSREFRLDDTTPGSALMSKAKSVHRLSSDGNVSSCRAAPGLRLPGVLIRIARAGRSCGPRISEVYQPPGPRFFEGFQKFEMKHNRTLLMSRRAENKFRGVVQARLKRQCRLWAGVLGRRSDGVLVRFPLATTMVRGFLGVLEFQGSTEILSG